MGGFAWVTLATNDSYSLGALVLAHSLRRAGTPHDLVALITPGVTDVMREKLSAVFSLVQEVNILDSKDEANLRLLARPELGITFTKLHCWRLTQYEKCVFVDADALVIRNCDELFEREELSAAPDVGWPDCFNSGVFVFKPSQQTYDSLVAFATAKGSFDGGDQGLLNMYFSDWAQKDIYKHLPFIYNMCSTAAYSYLPAFKQFGDDVRIIHFIGETKPWLQYLDTLTGIVQPPVGSNHLQPLLQVWWNIFCDNVHPQLNPDMATSTLAPPWHNISSFPPLSSIRPVLFQNLKDETYCDFGLNEPDFSEFRDPWETYSPQLDPFLRDIHQVPQEQPEDSGPERGYFQKSEETYISYEHSPQTLESQSYFEQPQHFWSDKDNEIRDYHHEHKESEDLSQRLETYQVEHEKKEEYHDLSYGYQNQEISQEQYKIHQEFQSHQEEHQFDQEFRSEYKEDHHSSHNEFQSHEEEHHFNQAFRSEYKEDHHSSHEEFQTHEQEHHFTHQEFQTQRKEVHPQLQSSDDSQSFRESQKIPSKGIVKSDIIKDKTASQKSRDRKSDSKQYKENDKQTKTHIQSQHPLKIRVIPKKVASQSEQRKKHPESKDTGVAGALAKLTLGEPRSNEQIAYEEHMRKQSWEQGQIDYLGRDSFENIWKKIAETLSAAPVREKTPPQDEPKLKKEVTEASVKEETKKIESKKSEEVTPAVGMNGNTEQQKPSVGSTPTTEESQGPVPVAVSEEKIESVNKQKEVGVGSETSNLALGEVEKITKTPVEVQKVLEPAKEIPVVPEGVQQTSVPESVSVIPIAEIQPVPFFEPVAEASAVPKEIQQTRVLQTPTTPKQIQPTPITETQATAEEVQEKPVPIQVAESVLQAEPKESVSQVTLPVGEEAISSIVSAVQESALAVSEALMDPPTSEPAAPKLENGSVDHQTETLPSTISSPPPTFESSTALLPRSSNVVSVIQEPQVVPVSEVQPKEEIKDTKVAELTKEPIALKAAEESKEPEKTEEAKQAEKTAELKETEKSVESKEPEKSVESKETEKTVELKEATEIEKSKQPQETKELKLQRRESSSMEKPLLPTCESKLTVQIPQSQPCEISGLVQKSKEEKKASESPSEGSPEKSSESEAVDSPARPMRSKEMKAPPTPTVTEATPPTSPPIDPEEEAEGEPKMAKKLMKKVVRKQSTEESEGAEGESSVKKVTKKVVKKVSKKKEGSEAEGSSSTEKTKKVVKKTATKTSQLEADKSVPETPPPGCSEVPIPPKRKVKPSTTKEMTSKKPGTEL